VCSPLEGGISDEAHCGGYREKTPLLGTLGYEQKALEMGLSLHRSSVEQPGVGSSTGDFEGRLKALEVGISLYGRSVKVTWREGSLAVYLRGYVEKFLEMGISFHRGPTGGTWKGGHLPGTLGDG